jgi:ABC-type multidrug transport system fused ATPase/permease subunit
MTTVAEPITEAPERDGAMKTLRRGLALSPELRRGLPGTVVLALVSTAGRVIIPIVVQQVLDNGLTENGVDMGFVWRMALAALAATFLTASATGWMQYRLAMVSETALSGLRIRAFRHIHDLSMLHQASEQRGALVARVTSDVDQISRFMQWGGIMLLVNGAQAIMALTVMAVFSLPMAIAVLVSVPVITMTIRWFQSRLERAYLAVREAVGHLLATLAEIVVGAPVIRAYGVEERTRAKLDEAIERHRSTGLKAGTTSAIFSGVGELYSSLVIALVLVVGTLLAANGSVSPGTVVAFLFLVQLFIQPIQVLGEAVNEAQTAVAGWRRVLDVLDIPPDVADPGDSGVALPNKPLDISFQAVEFRYPNPGETAAEATGTKALEKLDVVIDPHTKVAVVGETGSGKTTFAKLLTRLMDPTSGSVELGGVDVRRVQFDSLRDRVVMVPQEGSLFRGSIGDNVRMGRPDATRDELRAVFLRLGLDDWLDELAAGIDTQVGERGSALSVGERQLVALTRAAIADPELLVLDEATSAVDPATEVRISRALNQLSEGRTVVTIAHRLSTAEAADRVLVFDQARLVQDGPHAQLVRAGGVYARLYESWERGTAAS